MVGNRRNLPDEQRIVITGVGAVSPIGLTAEETWKNAVAGKNGIKEVTSFDTSKLKVHRAGEIPEFTPPEFLTAEQVESCGRASLLAISASAQALESAQVNLDNYSPRKLGVSFGTTMGEPQVFDTILDIIAEKGNREVPPHWWLKFPNHKIANNVAAVFGFQGPNFQIPTACAAGNYAISYAAELLRLKKADLMIAGGSDSISRIAFVGFNKLRAMAPEFVAPFDGNRKGMMIGEGAGAVVLERLSDAKRRNAPILAEFLGYGLSCDAHKMTAPHPEGEGGYQSIVQALAQAHLNPEDIDYISAHGTGTKENDRIETLLIKRALGDHAYNCPVSSLKSMTAHCMGASSAIEAVVCCFALRDGIIPPTINYQTPDPNCDLDYVPNEAREADLKVVLSNAYAFGGNCSTIALGKFQ